MLWACCRRFFSVVRWRRCSWGCSSSSLASTSPSLVATCDGDGGSFGNVDNSDVIGADLCELAIKQTKFIRRMSSGKKKVVTSHSEQKRVLSSSQERSWCTLIDFKRGLVACKTCIGSSQEVSKGRILKIANYEWFGSKLYLCGGGVRAACHRGSIRASHPVALGSILGIPKKFLMLPRFMDGT